MPISINTNEPLGNDCNGKPIYAFNGCQNYCCEPNSGSVYISNTPNGFKKTSFQYFNSYVNEATKDVIGGVVLDGSCYYIKGNRVSRIEKDNKVLTAINGYPYEFIVARGSTFNKQSLVDKDIEFILKSFGEAHYSEVIKSFGQTSEIEEISFAKFRGHIYYITIKDGVIKTTFVTLPSATPVEKALTNDYLTYIGDIISPACRLSFDASSLVDIVKEDKAYCFDLIQKELDKSMHNVDFLDMTQTLKLGKNTLATLKRNIKKEDKIQSSRKMLFYRIAYGYIKAIGSKVI